MAIGIQEDSRDLGTIFWPTPFILLLPSWYQPLTYPAKVFILDSRARCRMTILVRQVPMSLVAPAAQKRREGKLHYAVRSAAARIGCLNTIFTQLLRDMLPLKKKITTGTRHHPRERRCKKDGKMLAALECHPNGSRAKRGGKRGRWFSQCRINWH